MSTLQAWTPLAPSSSHLEPSAMVLRWSVSRKALAAVLTSASNGPDPELHVSVRFSETGAARASAHIADGNTTHTLHDDAQGTIHFAAGLTHIDIPGLLHATLRSLDEVRVLYASTPIFQRLGIPGGRYEICSTALRVEG